MGDLRCVMRGASFTAPDETRWIAVGFKKEERRENKKRKTAGVSPHVCERGNDEREGQKRRPKTVQGGKETESEKVEEKRNARSHPLRT